MRGHHRQDSVVQGVGDVHHTSAVFHIRGNPERPVQRDVFSICIVRDRGRRRRPGVSACGGAFRHVPRTNQRFDCAWEALPGAFVVPRARGGVRPEGLRPPDILGKLPLVPPDKIQCLCWLKNVAHSVTELPSPFLHRVVFVLENNFVHRDIRLLPPASYLDGQRDIALALLLDVRYFAHEAVQLLTSPVDHYEPLHLYGIIRLSLPAPLPTRAIAQHVAPVRTLLRRAHRCPREAVRAVRTAVAPSVTILPIELALVLVHVPGPHNLLALQPFVGLGTISVLVRGDLPCLLLAARPIGQLNRPHSVVPRVSNHQLTEVPILKPGQNRQASGVPQLRQGSRAAISIGARGPCPSYDLHMAPRKRPLGGGDLSKIHPQHPMTLGIREVPMPQLRITDHEIRLR
mmetsp:Transcript_60541/g.139687  ORF Transcript_60541/g.139687 Transcript_60541/m.139687 type:complete len:402 (-) Transcript_60541:500-1705(-)